MDARFLRNFAIIAHIDHGKSTLSDRLLELTGSVTGREMQAQILDDMDLERERGITIKAHAVRMMYKAHDGNTYQLNLIDTPGHVDFSYEVSRSLASCEGALLVVDASQGVEAQTLANAYLAINHGLEIIPVINKIDLPSADILRTQEAIEKAVGLDATDAIPVSAKTGQGVDEVLEAIVHRLPPPTGDPDAPLQALIFDSWFDAYRGVIVLVRVMQGTMRKGQRIRLMSNGKAYEIESMGVLMPKPVEIGELTAGEVGFFAATIKNVGDTKIGDTVTDDAHPAAAQLPGFEDIKPMVFSRALHGGLARAHAAARRSGKAAAERFVVFLRAGELGGAGLRLPLRVPGPAAHGDHPGAAGARVRAGPDHHRARRALPHHADRRKRDRGRQSLALARAAEHRAIHEPVITAKILTNEEYVGGIFKLVEEKRGKQINFEYVTPTRVMLTYELPLNEIVLDFYDRLKSISRGYASLDYQLAGEWESPMVKLDILVSGEPVDALSIIVHHDHAYERGRALVSKMRELIPRQQFEVAIQAAIGAKVVARETVSPLRKNVLAKCYGGDITRKRKLLEKQKEGKKRMKRIGKVDIPQEAFLAVLRVGEDQQK